MLAVCSDLDETPNRHVYGELMRFLNTTEPTALGPGVGLEIGNSIYFDMPPHQFAYWTTDDTGREMIRTLIRSGHIDCLHSYGDGARARSRAAHDLEELSRHECRLKIWVDHGIAVTNFGADIMGGFGDVPDHPAYHADLARAHGIRYIWRGRVTSTVGQDVPAHLGDTLDLRHPWQSVRTLAKELAKRQLARARHRKYALHRPNRVLAPVTLRDGQRMYEFLRANPHWGGVSVGDTADGIHEVLTDRNLGRLVEHEGVCILYTHLGKGLDPARLCCPTLAAAFRRLRRWQDDGRILVATTWRVLNYLTVRDHLKYEWELAGAVLRIIVHAVEEPVRGMWVPAEDDLCGITFETVPAERAEVKTADGRTIRCEIHRGGGRACITVPWPRLVFPAADWTTKKDKREPSMGICR